jgi:HSP20 family protein
MAKKDETRSVARWDPFGDLGLFEGWGSLRDPGGPRLTRALEEMFGARPSRPGGIAPALDVVEDDDQYVVTMELPGASKDDVTVECHEGMLTIRGEKKSEREGKKEQHRWVERSYGSFSRSFALPANAAGDQVKARFKDGVLTLEIPKLEQAKPRAVRIHD